MGVALPIWNMMMRVCRRWTTLRTFAFQDGDPGMHAEAPKEPKFIRKVLGAFGIDKWIFSSGAFERV